MIRSALLSLCISTAPLLGQQTSGTGCGGARLDFSDLTTGLLGSLVEVEIHQEEPSTPVANLGLLNIGTVSVDVALGRIAGPAACSFYTQPDDTVVFIPDPTRISTIRFSVPNNPALLGLTTSFQAGLLHPAYGGPIGLHTTNEGLVTVR